MKSRKFLLRVFKLQTVLVIILISNSFLWIYWITMKDPEKDIEESDITLFFSDFESFDNKIKAVVQNLQERFNFRFIIYCTHRPYPPIDFAGNTDINFIIYSDLSLKKSFSQVQLGSVLRTKYIAIMPNGVTLNYEFDYTILQRIHGILNRNIHLLALVNPHDNETRCLGLKFKLKEWTAQFYKVSKSELCDYVIGTHIIIMNTHDFLALPKPYLRPHYMSVYYQTVLQNWKVKMVKTTGISQITPVYKTPHSLWKHNQNELTRIKNMYHNLGIKLVQTSLGEEEWYGCSKESQRCFGTVINDMPEYLFEDRWTPPCCLNNIRTTARYVFRIFKSLGIRYWLEGGSLLGAARNGDIIPWDYDVDVGIYKEDILKSKLLIAAQDNKSIEDENGFIWEKAQEGDFFRVQFSSTNHLHVDIFPFYSRNGTMTKDTWLPTHKQDTEFPEHFLKPLDSIQFVGLRVSVPNNWRSFLEMKFGKGVIENPKYPNLHPVTKI